jgi:hypothetical protein
VMAKHIKREIDIMAHTFLNQENHSRTGPHKKDASLPSCAVREWFCSFKGTL